jgi:hypothetical protein
VNYLKLPELILHPQSAPPAAGMKQHGHLVAQILETKNELEDDGHHQSQDGQPKKVEIVSCIYFSENLPLACASHKANQQ